MIHINLKKINIDEHELYNDLNFDEVVITRRDGSGVRLEKVDDKIQVKNSDGDVVVHDFTLNNIKWLIDAILVV